MCRVGAQFGKYYFYFRTGGEVDVEVEKDGVEGEMLHRDCFLRGDLD